jgi:hypothetical protein
MVGLPSQPYTWHYAMYGPKGSFRLTTRKGDAWCLKEEGFELEGSYPSMRKRVRNIDKRISVMNCEEIRGLTAS